MDLDGNGQIDKSDMKKVISPIDCLTDLADLAIIDEFFSTFDADGDGKVQLSEWLDFHALPYDS